MSRSGRKRTLVIAFLGSTLRGGVVKQFLATPPRLREAEVASQLFLARASTPPAAQEGSRGNSEASPL